MTLLGRVISGINGTNVGFLLLLCFETRSLVAQADFKLTLRWEVTLNSSPRVHLSGVGIIGVCTAPDLFSLLIETNFHQGVQSGLKLSILPSQPFKS